MPVFRSCCGRGSCPGPAWDLGLPEGPKRPKPYRLRVTQTARCLVKPSACRETGPAVPPRRSGTGAHTHGINRTTRSFRESTAGTHRRNRRCEGWDCGDHAAQLVENPPRDSQAGSMEENARRFSGRWNGDLQPLASLSHLCAVGPAHYHLDGGAVTIRVRTPPLQRHCAARLLECLLS